MVRDAIPNSQLRAQVINYFAKVLPKNATHRQEYTAAVETIRHFPQVIDTFTSGGAQTNGP